MPAHLFGGMLEDLPTMVCASVSMNIYSKPALFFVVVLCHSGEEKLRVDG
jgi:hypothetical protein